MGPAPSREVTAAGVVAELSPGSVVYATGVGSNVFDVDGNRYVDLAAGFGALLLGHAHPRVLKVIELQAARLLLALGDVYPADAKVALIERLAGLYPEPGARVILGQSGADAVGAALATAVLATGRPGVVAFEGAYHGLSYAPLAACGLRESYRAPFSAQLNPHVRFVPYPGSPEGMELALELLGRILDEGQTGAVLFEPILGRGGCVVPPPGFVERLTELAHAAGALSIADEVWTGLGRSGALLQSVRAGATPPDLLCLGKGLGGGLPISACVGSAQVMDAWRREQEVVTTSTFAGSPLACATAIATLDVIGRESLVERSARLGHWWREELVRALVGSTMVREVRGAGLMVALDLGDRPGIAVQAMRGLLEAGYVVSTGGGSRAALVLTPALTVRDGQLAAFVPAARKVLSRLGG